MIENYKVQQGHVLVCIILLCRRKVFNTPETNKWVFEIKFEK